MLAPDEDKANNHNESNDQNDNPDNFHLGDIVFIRSEAELNNECKIHIMIFCNNSDVFPLYNTWISIFYDDFQFFVELNLGEMVNEHIIK